ncbi:hypothetical protein DL89DRAFT_294111 [Linderina pennispora]|uniref:AAA+ ATPase domain-containing protein n=1 Tax=Linderina pennispora TaxID=61395 RepID=A0A1Y1W470_9FUNG|nr:uncharacterized protein DL89DRAFT_294111 [Linderina pennispora]ORX68182.1 hypothetical protein DL89DRAFT_294111 [Linderina pennispora]
MPFPALKSLVVHGIYPFSDDTLLRGSGDSLEFLDMCMSESDIDMFIEAGILDEGRFKALQTPVIDLSDGFNFNYSVLQSRVDSFAPTLRVLDIPGRRAALAEAPVSRQQQATSSLKDSFPVAKTTGKILIIGRSAEQSSIRAFLRDTVEQNRGGSLYISGNPGTGKTACLQSIMSQSKVKFTSVLVNCVPLTRPTQASPGDPLGALENHVLHNKRAFMVVLDEVDSLLGARQETRIWRWFGIANALDLTDRFLPRLQARNCEPVLLNFNPAGLSSVSGQEAEPIIQKAALELCARKVAATSGDLRKALDVTLMHIAKVLTNLNGSPIMQKLNALNFQQKLAKKQTASIAVTGVFSEYQAICTQLQIPAPVTRSEFLDLISMMETQGVLTIEAARGRRGARRVMSSTGAADDRSVRLAVDEIDVRRALTSTAALKPLF